MFSRNNDRPATDDRRSTAAPATPAGVRDVSVSPSPSLTPTPQSMPNEVTHVGRADRMEGTLKVQDMLRILGTVEGSVEASTVHIEEGAKVRADITADEVIIGGDYSGKLVCRQRLEIRATGQVVGHVETFRLMLHEGGSIDGELKMLKQPATDPASERIGSSRSSREPSPRSTASLPDGTTNAAATASPNGQPEMVAVAVGPDPAG